MNQHVAHPVIVKSKNEEKQKTLIKQDIGYVSMKKGRREKKIRLTSFCLAFVRTKSFFKFVNTGISFIFFCYLLFRINVSPHNSKQYHIKHMCSREWQAHANDV